MRGRRRAQLAQEVDAVDPAGEPHVPREDEVEQRERSAYAGMETITDIKNRCSVTVYTATPTDVRGSVSHLYSLVYREAGRIADVFHVGPLCLWTP